MTNNHITSVIEKGIEEACKKINATLETHKVRDTQTDEVVIIPNVLPASPDYILRTFANTLLQSVEEECEEAKFAVPEEDEAHRAYNHGLSDLQQTLREARGG